MGLSNNARRAIALRRSIARKAAATPTTRPANDNKRRTARRSGMSDALTAACVAAAGFEQHAAYGC